MELRPAAGIMEIRSGLLTRRKREENIDWNAERMRLVDSFSALFVT